MSNLEERRVSFDQGPKPPNLIQAAAAAAKAAEDAKAVADAAAADAAKAAEDAAKPKP